MASSYILAAHRTPIGKFLGNLSSIPAVELGAHALRETFRRSTLPMEMLEHVIMGQVLTAGVGQAPARQASLRAGFDHRIGAVTINKVCGSGLFAVMLADLAIRASEFRCILAGGMESMSQAPHLLDQARIGWKFGSRTVRDSVESDGLRCAYEHKPMGEIAESLSVALAIDRAEQDGWACRSHRLAIDAQNKGSFQAEIIGLEVGQGKKKRLVDSDEGPRADCSEESLASLKPVFASQEALDSGGGYVTAGNASSLSDGAAALVVVDEEIQRQFRTDSAFRIVGHCSYATEPKDLFTAPAHAIQWLLSKTGRRVSEIDQFEINEAFAVQTLACIKLLGIDPSKVNRRGGAIALGHPIGCSGARILVTLIHSMIASQERLGIASLCLGGGEAVAIMIERI